MFFSLLHDSKVYLHGSSQLQLSPSLQNSVELLLFDRPVTNLIIELQLDVNLTTSGDFTNPAASL